MTELTAYELDQLDPLKHLRDEFHIPKVTYLCGNSLGLQPKQTEKLINEELQVWKTSGVDGHFDHEFKRPWAEISDLCLSGLADLVGAEQSEVAAMGSLTSNLHLLMISFYRPELSRRMVLVEDKAFPSDIFAVESQRELHGLSDCLIRAKDQDEIMRIIENRGNEIALVLLGGVNFYSGEFLDMQKITLTGHMAGCIVGFDLAHAIGNVPLSLHEWQVDFAVWCSYKYLNAGPGAIAGLFVHSMHDLDERPRLRGWWGSENRFQMLDKFVPISGARRYQLSNPDVLSMVSLHASLNVFSRTSMAEIRKKSELQTDFLIRQLLTINNSDFEIITPMNPKTRGSQISIRISGNKYLTVVQKLKASRIIVDERPPNVIRVTAVPLYNSFSDIQVFLDCFQSYINEI